MSNRRESQREKELRLALRHALNPHALDCGKRARVLYSSHHVQINNPRCTCGVSKLMRKPK